MVDNVIWTFCACGTVVAWFNWIWHTAPRQLLHLSSKSMRQTDRSYGTRTSSLGWWLISNNDRHTCIRDYFSMEKSYKFIGSIDSGGAWRRKHFAIGDCSVRHAVTVCTHASRLPSIIISKLMHSKQYIHIFKRCVRRTKRAPSSWAQRRQPRIFHEYSPATRCAVCVCVFCWNIFSQRRFERNSSVSETSYREFVNGGTHTHRMRCIAEEILWLCHFFRRKTGCHSGRPTASHYVHLWESGEMYGPWNATACGRFLFEFMVAINHRKAGRARLLRVHFVASDFGCFDVWKKEGQGIGRRRVGKRHWSVV